MAATTSSAKPDMLNAIMAYESGDMTDEEDVIAFFQRLVDTGLAFQLQGSYGRTAHHMIQNGLISLPTIPR